MGNQQQIIQLIKSISGQANVLVTPVLYLDMLDNDHKAALFLNQCVYWGDRTQDRAGWFYHSRNAWFEELRLTREEQERITDKLKALGVIETKLKKANTSGIPAPTLHYRIVYDNLYSLISKTLDLRESHKSDLRESHKSMDLRESHKSINIDYTEIKNNNIEKGGTKRQTDERLKHPALMTYRRYAHLTVVTTWRDRVIETVGDSEENLKLWGEIVDSWKGHGWNPGNVSDMLKAFSAGGIKDIRKNGTGKKVLPPPIPANTNLDEEFARNNPGKKL